MTMGWITCLRVISLMTIEKRGRMIAKGFDIKFARSPLKSS
jgi:hypothetical protein